MIASPPPGDSPEVRAWVQRMDPRAPRGTARVVRVARARPPEPEPPRFTPVKRAVVRAAGRFLRAEIRLARAVLSAVVSARTITRTVYLVEPESAEEIVKARGEEAERDAEETAAEGREWFQERTNETDDSLERVVRHAKPVAPELLLPRSIRERLEPPADRRRKKKARRVARPKKRARR
jgi:hypothetical protein